MIIFYPEQQTYQLQSLLFNQCVLYFLSTNYQLPTTNYQLPQFNFNLFNLSISTSRIFFNVLALASLLR
jgi:hypothetical protein